MTELLLAISLLATPAPFSSGGGSTACAGDVVGTASVTLSPSDTLVEARIVFVTFPDSPDSTMPAWADSMADELSRFLAGVSRGHHRVHVQVVRRDDNPNAKWRAPLPSITYATPGGPQWWNANEDVLRAIALERPGVWDGVEHVWAIHDQCAFACTSPDSPGDCEDTCPWGGIASLGLNAASVPGLLAEGTTQRFIVPLPPARQHQVQLSFAAHEYGHRLGAGHSPGSDRTGDAFVNYGRYDLMRSGQFGSLMREEGLLPYHPMLLADWGWVPRQIVDVSTMGVRLPALLGPRGVVVQVRPRRSTQSFLLVHPDGRTPWDAHYGGDGLHIWHIRRDALGRNDLAWDLESAAGRDGDPVTGRDALERDPFALGSAADFFTPAGANSFTALTNPASGLYNGDATDALETARSGVSIENLRTDPATGDLLVDVYLSPVQHLEPLGVGTRLEPGDTLRVEWTVRPSAQVVGVDLDLLDAGGGMHTLAANLPNSGSWRGPLSARGAGLRVRLASRDSTGEVGADTSAAFDVAPGDTQAAALLLSSRSENPARDGARWTFSLAREQRVRLTVFDPAGRTVAVLADAVFAAGQHTRAWDARDATGRRVPAGLYFIRLETRDGTRLGRLAVAP